MGIEQRITDALETRLGHFIKRAEQALMAEKQRVLRPLGLSVPQYSALHALSISPMSGAQMARVCCVTPQSMASLLATLESKKLVERTPSPVHSHVMVVKLTRSGHALFRKADAAALQVEAKLSAALGPDEEKSLRVLLQRSIEVLSED